MANYVVVQALLVALGFTCFTMDRDATDSRLTIAMGLVLSINVFQVVLVENTPETGYLTLITWYTISNEVLLILIAIQAVFMGHCHRVNQQQIRLREKLRMWIGQKSGEKAAVRLQRAYRRLRASKWVKSRSSSKPSRWSS